MPSSDARASRLVAVCGLAGLLGSSLFSATLVFLQMVRGDVDWANDYVSYFANGRHGWIFVSAALMHGAGNFATGVGLYLALERSPLRAVAGLSFAVAAFGIIVAALTTPDTPGAPPSASGALHQYVATVGIPTQLGGVLLFSAAFGRHARWRAHQRSAVVIASIATVALVGLYVAVRLGTMLGIAERLSLGSLLAWNVWAARHLVRAPGTS